MHAGFARTSCPMVADPTPALFLGIHKPGAYADGATGTETLRTSICPLRARTSRQAVEEPRGHPLHDHPPTQSGKNDMGTRCYLLHFYLRKAVRQSGSTCQPWRRHGLRDEPAEQAGLATSLLRSGEGLKKVFDGAQSLMQKDCQDSLRVWIAFPRGDTHPSHGVCRIATMPRLA
jgi:hypothetical protein